MARRRSAPGGGLLLVCLAAAGCVGGGDRVSMLDRELVLGEYENDLRQISRLEDEIRAQRSRVAALKRRVDERDAEIADLLARLRETEAEANELRGQVAEAEQTSAGIRARIDEESKAIAGLEAALGEEQENQKKIAARIEGARAETRALERELDLQRAALVQRRLRLLDLEAASAALGRSIHAAEAAEAPAPSREAGAEPPKGSGGEDGRR